MLSLDALADALGEANRTIFFRDDDGGWATPRLKRLVECFRQAELVLDLAIIPAALDSVTAVELKKIYEDCEPVVRVHQHGFAHVNHQTNGRKSEFGTNRTFDQQYEDIARGKQLLENTFGVTDPIFTPPWNRCDARTVAALEALDFKGLSRITGSASPVGERVAEIPVAVDWEKKRDGIRLSTQEFITYVNKNIRHTDVVGVMLHHAQMTDDDLERFNRFLLRLKQNPRLRFDSMRNLLPFT